MKTHHFNAIRSTVPRKSIRKASLLSVAFGMSLLMLSGCGTSSAVTNAANSGNPSTSGGQSSPNSSSANQSSANQSTGSSANKGTLVIYEAEGYAKPVAKAFTKKTGIQVKIVHLATGSLAAKIQAEGNYPQWDLAWFDGAGTMQALDNEGLLNTGFTPNDLSNYTSLGNSLLPKDDAYFPTGVSAAAVIAYNTKLMTAAEAPKDWSDLLKPQYKNEIAMNDPSISGPTYPFVAGILQTKGLTAGEQYFTSLKQNGLQVFAKNGPTVQAMLSGKVKIALAQDAALTGFQMTGNPIKIIYPPSGTYALAGVIGIAKNAANKSAAEQFVEFCLTPEAQSIMVDAKVSGSDSYHTPLVTGVQANSHVQTSGVKWVVVNAIQAASRRSSVLKWFSDNIVH
ncbi:extracellular solute-binding protein [Alicyclobacillus curvatus]|nr:extracellular solute-binding protein [Alicyclobacillus curvatus]